MLTQAFDADLARLRTLSAMQTKALRDDRRASLQSGQRTAARLAGELRELQKAMESSNATLQAQLDSIDARRKMAVKMAPRAAVSLLPAPTAQEVAAAAEAGKKTGLPVCATMTFDTAKRSMMGVTPADFAREAEQLGLSLMGSNCGVGPAELMHSTRELLAVNSPIPVVAKGNCGIPEYVDGAIHYHGSPELMAQYAVFARDAGAKIIGGCCGTTPAHVAAIKAGIPGATIGLAYLQILQDLTDHGADLDLEDQRGRTPEACLIEFGCDRHRQAAAGA